MGVCWALISSEAPERQQSRGDSRASSGPSLSLPVPDSARSARGGSLPSFSQKCCRNILNQSALLEQVEQGQEEQLQAASGALLWPISRGSESFCAGHPVQTAHWHQCPFFVDYDLFVIIKRQSLKHRGASMTVAIPFWAATPLPFLLGFSVQGKGVRECFG